MARCMRMPVKVSPRGGTSLTSALSPSEALHTVIAVSLVPGDTMHPWDKLEGLAAPGAVYRHGDGTLSSFIEQRFKRLEGRAELASKPAIAEPDASGRRSVSITFDNLETSESEILKGTI